MELKLEEGRPDYENDKEYVLAMFRKACYGAYSADVEEIEESRDEGGDIDYATVWFKKRLPQVVDVKGLGPFEMVAKIIRQAKLK
ncbi:hypothetical protein [uncultured Dialister sp.]|jgi:hypothetical protein|uniref:hypothetical protein n=1 Tax=uncultured Dialister sp. TaxID=278064 RepID=UPI00263A11C5|nr:hypothetical protein [uncultured Dialister sp.]